MTINQEGPLDHRMCEKTVWKQAQPYRKLLCTCSQSALVLQVESWATLRRRRRPRSMLNSRKRRNQRRDVRSLWPTCESRSIIIWTRMHSSRIRTVFCSGRRGACRPACTGQGACMYPSMHWAGGVLAYGGLPGGVHLGAICPGGCLPGVCLPRGVSAWGVCLPGGVCLPRSVSAQGCLPWGYLLKWCLSAWECLLEGCLSAWECLPGCVCPGVSAWGGVCLGASVCGHLPDIPSPPANRMTDKCLWKHYLAATSLRTVIINLTSQIHDEPFPPASEKSRPVLLGENECLNDFATCWQYLWILTAFLWVKENTLCDVLWDWNLSDAALCSKV